MHTPILYRITRIVVRAALGFYFKKIEMSGRHRIPQSGPVIFAANHPQSVTDALILGYGAGRMLHFLAHSGLFRNRWTAWFLRHSGVIPVYRQREVDGAAEKNVKMFSACRELLERGGAIGIFPEGTSAEERRVQRLKTGTARMAFQAEAANNWRLGVQIVPVGLNFESRRCMRTRILMRFGDPIAVAAYRTAYEEDPVEAVNRLTGDLQDAIRRRVVNIERPEFERLAGDIERIYKGELIARGEIPIPGGSKFKRDQLLSREIARALDHFFEWRPEVVWRIERMMSRYRRKLERLRVRDDMLDGGRGVREELARFIVLGVLGLLPAMWGVLWNYLPYKVTGWLAVWAAPDETKVHYYHLTLGAAVYLAYYGPLLYLAYRSLGPAGAGVFTATLPPSGLFARVYVRRLIRRQRMVRFAWLEVAREFHVERLKAQRRELIGEMDAALEEYVHAAGTPRRGTNTRGSKS